MGNIRKKHSPQFKAKVALDAIKEKHSLNELAAKYGVHQVQISKWKKELLDSSPLVFTNTKADPTSEWTKEKENLHRTIGEITVERDWLKKKLHH